MSRRRGGVMVLVVAGMATLVAVGAWVVDGAMLLSSRTKQQAAADAGALAATFGLLKAGQESAGKIAAVDFVKRNGFTIAPGDVQFWDRPGGKGRAVTVAWQQPVAAGFSRLFGATEHAVGVRSSATLGGLGTVPPVAVPFGLPAEKGPDGTWRLLSLAEASDGGAHSYGGGGGDDDDLLVFAPLSLAPANKLVLKVGAGGSNGGNFMPLLVGAAGASAYRDAITNGIGESLAIGQRVETEPGNMVGPTTQGVLDRLARGDSFANVVVPLIPRAEWEADTGRSEVTIVGMVAVRLDPQVVGGVVTATYQNAIVPGIPVLDAAASPGVRAPILIPTPGTP